MDSGELEIDGKAVRISHPAQAIAHRMALLPEDRKQQGLVLLLSVADNIVLAAPEKLSAPLGLVPPTARMARARQFIDSLRIKTPSARQQTLLLSGGNQQKVVLAKWLETDPTIVLLNDPARGVDIGAKLEIYRIISEQAEAGRIVLFHSTELQEFAQVCDRVLIFHRGRLAGELVGDDINDHALLHAINVGAGANVAGAAA
jgi:ABC-type sugar transport system ATPase subunit